MYDSVTGARCNSLHEKRTVSSENDNIIGFKLIKEPDNEYDKEAILVKMEGIGKLGYVANSPYTVLGDSMSAGRLYDRIGEKAYGKVILVTPQGTLCKISKKSMTGYLKEKSVENVSE